MRPRFLDAAPTLTQVEFVPAPLRIAELIDTPVPLYGLAWIERTETGFDVTVDNRDAVIDELARLRAWMVVELGARSYDVERLGRLVDELRALRFEPGVRAFVG